MCNRWSTAFALKGIDERVRRRLLNTLEDRLQNDPHTSFGTVLAEVEQKLHVRLGGLKYSHFEAARRSDHAVIEHFYCCTDEEVMDFLQFCFESPMRCGGQSAVGAINEVLEQENIGYELTPFVETSFSPPTPRGIFAAFVSNQVTPPKVLRRDEKHIHKTVIQPTLHALADARFATANTELMNAFEEYRKAKYADAVTDAGAGPIPASNSRPAEPRADRAQGQSSLTSF